MTNYDQYSISVFWSDEDEGFIATAPDLPGCSAYGKTAEDAVAEVKTVIRGWIEAMADIGNPIPPPSKYDPHHQYSGKVLVRMPKALHGQLVSRAKAEGVSLNSWMVFLLTKGSVERASNATPAEASQHIIGSARETARHFHVVPFEAKISMGERTLFLHDSSVGKSQILDLAGQAFAASTSSSLPEHWISKGRKLERTEH
jgi:antitoxin HicB